MKCPKCNSKNLVHGIRLGGIPAVWRCDDCGWSDEPKGPGRWVVDVSNIKIERVKGTKP